MASPQVRSRKRQILAEIAKLDFCLPGSLVERTTRCGTPTCRCRDPERRHGPYPSWIRKVGTKSVTRTLSAEQAERYRPWFDNARRLRQLVNELEALSVQAISEAEGWDDLAEKRPQPRRRRSRERVANESAGSSSRRCGHPLSRSRELALVDEMLATLTPLLR